MDGGWGTDWRLMDGGWGTGWGLMDDGWMTDWGLMDDGWVDKRAKWEWSYRGGGWEGLRTA